MAARNNYIETTVKFHMRKYEKKRSALSCSILALIDSREFVKITSIL